MSFNFTNCLLLSSFALKWGFSSANIIPSIIQKKFWLRKWIKSECDLRTQYTCIAELTHSVGNKLKDFLSVRRNQLSVRFLVENEILCSKEKAFFVPVIKWLQSVWPNSWEARCALEETSPGGIFALTVGTWLSGSNGKSFYSRKDFNPALLVVATIRTFFSCQYTNSLPPVLNYWIDNY